MPETAWEFESPREHHGGRSSVVERQVVDLDVAGSNPVDHPMKVLAKKTLGLQSLFGLNDQGYYFSTKCFNKNKKLNLTYDTQIQPTNQYVN